MATTPSPTAPALDEDGTFSPAWSRFFSDLVSSPAPIQRVTPTASPFIFTAAQRGFLQITGGAGLGVNIVRGRITIPAGILTGFIPVSAGDAVRINYTAAPTLYFLAS
jgi:hypothetical protein